MPTHRFLSPLAIFSLFSLPLAALLICQFGFPAQAMGSLSTYDNAVTASGPGSFLVPLSLFGGIALAWLFGQCFAPPNVRRLVLGALIGAVTAALLFSPIPAMAADAATDTSITIPWGNWLSSAAGALTELLVAALVAAVTWLASKVSTPVATLLKTLLTEQNLQRAVSYGVNAVAGAGHDHVLTISIANDVVREALKYFLDHAPAWLVSWLGSPEQIAQMIIARLKLEPAAYVSTSSTDGSATIAAAPAAVPAAA